MKMQAGHFGSRGSWACQTCNWRLHSIRALVVLLQLARFVLLILPLPMALCTSVEKEPVLANHTLIESRLVDTSEWDLLGKAGLDEAILPFVLQDILRDHGQVPASVPPLATQSAQGCAGHIF